MSGEYVKFNAKKLLEWCIVESENYDSGGGRKSFKYWNPEDFGISSELYQSMAKTALLNAGYAHICNNILSDGTPCLTWYQYDECFRCVSEYIKESEKQSKVVVPNE